MRTVSARLRARLVEVMHGLRFACSWMVDPGLVCLVGHASLGEFAGEVVEVEFGGALNCLVGGGGGFVESG